MIGKILCRLAKAFGGCNETPSVVQPCGTIDINLMASIILDKLDEMGCDADIHLPDMECKIYRKEDVKNCWHLKEVSGIPYVAETMDCDDHAAMMFGYYLGLVWTNNHALNFFISADEVFWFVEPQTGQIAQQLEGWQGNDIRFFIGR